MTYDTFTVSAIVKESSEIVSVYLTHNNDSTFQKYLPGQFVSLKMKPVNGTAVLSRNYTLSDSPGKGCYRITIKKEEFGVFSSFVHKELQIGSLVEISEPTGQFFLDKASRLPVVLISGGVGITPMMSMLEYIFEHLPKKDVHFIHSGKDFSDFPFYSRLMEIKAKKENFYLSFYQTGLLKKALASEPILRDGRISIESFKSLPDQEMEYYLCGPGNFNQSVSSQLAEKGVDDKFIHFEFFGENRLGSDPNSVVPLVNWEVRFTESKKSANWTGEKRSILELAESVGLSPKSGCRMGTCLTCETSLVSGTIQYDPEPFFEPEQGKVLICCAFPQSQLEISL